MAVYLIVLAAGYLFFYLFGIGNFDQICWDETTYVNAARSYLEGVGSYPNPEHPPLGKQLIALGIRLFGDNPEGWRIVSAVFGALSMVLVVYLVYRLTRRRGVALFVGLLLFLDPLLYIHFRLATLDPPLLFFFLSGLSLAVLFYLDGRAPLGKIILMAICLGLATASKLLTLVLMPVPLALVGYHLFRTRAPRKKWIGATLSVVIIPPLLFVSSYLLLGYRWNEIGSDLRFMFAFHGSYSDAMALSLSRWHEWLYIGKPMWYYLVKSGPDRYLAMLATGNLVLWIGAQLLALYALIRQARRVELWALAAVILIQFVLYASKPNTFLFYMVMVLPFLYVLMGVGIGDLFDRYGEKYRWFLRLDLACYLLMALLVFWNYFPYIWGRPITESQFRAAKSWGILEQR